MDFDARYDILLVLDVDSDEDDEGVAEDCDQGPTMVAKVVAKRYPMSVSCMSC